MHSLTDIERHLKRHQRWYWRVPVMRPLGQALWWGAPVLLVALGIGSFVVWPGLVGVALITLSVFLASGGGLMFHYMRQRCDVAQRSQIIVAVAKIVPPDLSSQWSSLIEHIHHHNTNNALWWTTLDQLCHNVEPQPSPTD